MMDVLGVPQSLRLRVVVCSVEPAREELLVLSQSNPSIESLLLILHILTGYIFYNINV